MKTGLPPLVRLLRDPGHFLALGFGSGLAPVAPGTFGSLVGLALHIGLSRFLALPAYTLAVVVLAAAGVWLCGRAARALGGADPGAVVWDEIVGMLVALAGMPHHWSWWLAGFLLFRVFDIAKPWPVSWADRRLSGGLGIMMDDLLAGGMTLGLLALARGLLPSAG